MREEEEEEGAPVERVAYTVAEFCKAYRISKPKLYQLWKAGKGPRSKRDGRWIIITVDDAKKWAAADNELPTSQVM